MHAGTDDWRDLAVHVPRRSGTTEHLLVLHATGDFTNPDPHPHDKKEPRTMNRRTIAIAALAAGSLLLAACGDDDDQTATDMPAMDDDAGMDDAGHGGGHDADEENSPVADGARQIEVTATDFAFDPGDITVEAGEDLAIVLTSEDILHDFTIDELDAHVAADRGETAEGGVTAEEAGTYTYYCSVSGHREAGMEGTLTVE